MLVNSTHFSPWICLFSSAGQQAPADVLLSPKPAKIMKREEAPAADPCLSQISPKFVQISQECVPVFDGIVRF